ncbi:diguanylate cyclase (GGDEF) domain-containing protein [Desulfosporosinus acidiphilus SJ4]|uniref:Stage 0 sporulation protein A homolog n=1 Tax=Desulfosporosinus acidiphilus (strain DSM 22704 / JCM 16185 / SJ4) TaxID=646529 RepID=I4D921_DESAJ|nr:response regulator [Desulfosporosinus acidiphilus]AFM42295.1 diguanylate cyclase (GGDEF) domain-containing protein [Desulfosporosinus acidiphilus SJ4]
MNTNVVEIAEDIFWVGGSDQEGGLHCNPYLLIDGDEAVLIDPGSVLDFDYVFENVCSIVPLAKIKYIVLHHQDPDLCASVPLFEQKGAVFEVVTHWRTQTIVKYYGIKSKYYSVNEHDFRLTLKSGRVLGFVQTPYLHFPGAIATYDYSSKTLFSSDLFGAFSYGWSLYAGEDYLEKMKTFHEHYMPSNDILRPVMEVFLGMDISMIAPQHGSIIRNNVTKYIKALRDLECGAFMAPLKKDLAKSGGYQLICSLVFKRYAAIFNKTEVLEAINDLDISFDQETLEISDYNYTGKVLWNLLFERFLARKGLQWLIVIEPFVKRLAEEYDISIPEVFITTLKRAEEEAVNLTNENVRLKEMNDKLNNSVREAQESLIKCPVTGLYNYQFFRNYLESELKDLLTEQFYQNPALILINTDNMAKIKFSYGDKEVDEVLKNIVYIINDLKDENTVLFRLQGASFACYLPHILKETAVEFAEKVRNEIAASNKFIEKITVSIGVISLEEIRDLDTYVNDPAEALYNIALMRVRLAKNMGMNIVCQSSSVETYQEELGRILVVDNDAMSIDVLKTFLESLNYQVFTANDGEQALEIAERQSLDLIISDVMIPKIDGFLVREKLLSQSHTKNIPFILISHLKNDDSVKRAMSLNIDHYLKKPFMLSELLGLVTNRVKGAAFL